MIIVAIVGAEFLLAEFLLLRPRLAGFQQFALLRLAAMLAAMSLALAAIIALLAGILLLPALRFCRPCAWLMALMMRK